MIKGSNKRKAEHFIEPLFIDRWSPRAMSGESIDHELLLTLFEAARWAPSAYNNQPWRFLYAHHQTPHWPLFFDVLAEANKTWVAKAAVLVLVISKTTFDHNGKPSITHSFDTGAAWQNFALQGFQKNLVVHGMQGFDYEQARKKLNIPDDYQIEAMIAVGKPGLSEELTDVLKEREMPNERRLIQNSICEGIFTL